MRIRDCYWSKNIFRKDSEVWKIRITIYASEEEIRALRNLEAGEVLKKAI